MRLLGFLGALGAGTALCAPALADQSFAPGLGLFALAPLPKARPATAPTGIEALAGAAAANAPVGRSGDCAAPTLAPEAIQAMVEAEAARQKVDVKLALAIVRQESRFGLDLNSAAGAHGVMQLIATTAARYGVHDLCDPSESIRGGVAYIKDLTALYRGNVLLVLAGYNAGEKRVKAAGGVPPLAETVRYVAAGVNDYYGLGNIVNGGEAPDQSSPDKTLPGQTDPAGQRWIGGSVLYVTEEARP